MQKTFADDVTEEADVFALRYNRIHANP